MYSIIAIIYEFNAFHAICMILLQGSWQGVILEISKGMQEMDSGNITGDQILKEEELAVSPKTPEEHEERLIPPDGFQQGAGLMTIVSSYTFQG